MILDGRELRLVHGAIMVYLGVPLHFAVRDRDPVLEGVLDDLARRIHLAREKAYWPEGAERPTSWAKVVERHLNTKLSWRFTVQEREALGKALDACAEELRMDPKADVNICFNGDEYGIRREDFLEMRRRLLEEP